MDRESEKRWIERARAGDEEALAQLFREHESQLVRMVALRLDPSLRRRLDPGDIVQEAWLDAQSRFPAWRERESLPFHVWLRLVTAEALARAHRRNLGTHMRDAMREALAADSRPSISAAALADEFVTSATTPTQAVRRDEVRARVHAALSELDELDREIVALRHFEGRSNEEAAAELAIEPAAASKRFVRALLRLRPALAMLAPEAGADAR